MDTDIDELTWGKLPDLFRRDVDRTGVCWLWIGPTFLPKESIKPRANYGNQSIYMFVYRLMCERPAKGREIHHQCHQPLCVRPSHLEVLTTVEHLARHHAGPLREFCKNGHSVKQFGDHVFPIGLKACAECFRLRGKRALAKLNALPPDEKRIRNQRSNEFKKQRSLRDPEYAQRQQAYRRVYNQRYWKDNRDELTRRNREAYAMKKSAHNASGQS